MNGFDIDGYDVLRGFVDEENCRQLTNELNKLIEKKLSTSDKQCPSSEAIYGIETFDSLLEELLPHFEKQIGRKLKPTYSYARLYKPGEELKIHKDRPACEISATLTLGFEGNIWPIYIGDFEDKTNSEQVALSVGDILLYKGCEKYHWREKYTEGQWQAQVFLHYVDSDGPNIKEIYDGRNSLAHKKEKKQNDMFFRIYDDVLTQNDCEGLIRTYSPVETIPGKIGEENNNSENKEIRNVNRILLPTYKNLGARLAAVGFDANAHIYKFDITRANQAEFLIYPSGNGRYKGHVDTMLNLTDDCRKLTVLAFLNDNYTGGKFYLQNSHERFYPPQKAGTILVFPSFLLHGVEDVQEGTRYSAVCWMVGPWFK